MCKVIRCNKHIMKTFWFFLVAFVMGFMSAIPVGAVQIEVARRSLNDQLRAAYLTALGSVCSDIMYGLVAMFGVAPFLEDRTVVAVFGLCATAILWVLAFFTFKGGARSVNGPGGAVSKSKSDKMSLVIGFTLSVPNPMMIVWWLIGGKFIRGLGLIRNFTTGDIFVFLAAGGLGLFSYPAALANILYRTKKFISRRMLKKINYGLGAMLVGLSFYFLISSLRKLAHS